MFSAVSTLHNEAFLIVWGIFMRRSITLLVMLSIVLYGIFWLSGNSINLSGNAPDNRTNDPEYEDQGGILDRVNPLSIASLRAQDFKGSDIVIEERIEPGTNYNRYIVSYQSDGNKIYALLTIPQGEVSKTGWPVIIFNHGYISPSEYRTTERYIAYTDGFSRNGYIVFRSDYRGHGNSEGQAEGGYGSNAYTIDILNAVASVKKLKDPEGSTNKVVDVNRIGMWGHSMGGHITLHNMVVNKDIKAGVIWAGVVASYPDLINNWRRSMGPTSTPRPGARRWRQMLVEQFGEPSDQSLFWRSISSNFFLEYISGPVQLHHGTADESVPVDFSRKLEEQLKAAGKTVEYYEYEGDDHNITYNFGVAMERSIEFFEKHVKNTTQNTTSP